MTYQLLKTGLISLAFFQGIGILHAAPTTASNDVSIIQIESKEEIEKKIEDRIMERDNEILNEEDKKVEKKCPDKFKGSANQRWEESYENDAKNLEDGCWL